MQPLNQLKNINSNMVTLALIAENPQDFILQSGKIHFAHQQQYPILNAYVQDLASRFNQIEIRPLDLAKEQQKTRAFLLDGVIHALYADRDVNAQAIDPTRIVAVMEEANLKPHQFINGRFFGSLLKDYDRLENVIGFQLFPKRAREKLENAADKMKKILLMRETGIAISRELTSWEERYKKEMAFIHKPLDEKIESVEKALTEIFKEVKTADDKPLKFDIDPAMLRDTVSLDDALAQVLKPTFRLPEPPNLEMAMKARHEMIMNLGV